MGKFVFKAGDPSNNKFYVIISGEVAVILPQNVGEWGKLTVTQKSKKKTQGTTHPTPQDPNAQNQPSTLSNLDQPMPTDEKKVTIVLSNSGDNTGKSKTESQLLDDKLLSNDNTPSLKMIPTPRASEVDGVKKEETPSNPKKAGNSPPSGFGTFVKSVNKFKTGTSKKIEDEVVKEEEDEEEDIDAQTKEFEEYASRFGRIARYSKQGESFGELALKNNAPRSAAILCKTDCEFLVITKNIYDAVFGKLEREREEFLKSAFPMLTTSVTSSANMNFLLFFFKTEVYPRGTYLTVEGKTTAKDPKFFIIQQGECAVEKKLHMSLANPYDRKKTVLSNNQPLQVSNAGTWKIVERVIF
jgi:cAMP-binding proteins - catabolite gene activator and regulatory subunit of cAMP-dependent protein kinases